MANADRLTEHVDSAEAIRQPNAEVGLKGEELLVADLGAEADDGALDGVVVDQLVPVLSLWLVRRVQHTRRMRGGLLNGVSVVVDGSAKGGVIYGGWGQRGGCDGKRELVPALGARGRVARPNECES